MLRRSFLVLGALSAVAAAREPVRTRQAMVVTQEENATDVGVAALKRGGNAIDAAVAVGFALAVTYPWAGNLGGGGFLLARFADGRTAFLDFREQAPQAASRDMYVDSAGSVTKESLVGWRAAGVPGTVRGLELAHQKWGKLPWKELVDPAVRLAAQGFPVTYSQSQSLSRNEPLLGQFPESKRIFLRDGKPFEPGERLYQPELAATLWRIAEEGSRDFYEGETARRLAEQMRANGGLITLEDLKAYRAAERKPMEGRYRDFGIVTAPPPSSGGVGMLQMMAVLDGSGYERGGAESASTVHFVAETMRRWYADRSEHLGDPDFFKVPVRGLLHPRYIAQIRASINPNRASPSAGVRPGKASQFEPSETTHFSIVDAEGNAVALTYTINGGYGNGVTVPGLGFLLNNEMDDFSAKPGVPNLFGAVGGEANAIVPRKRPLSSMTPTIVTRAGKTYLVIGAPGGTRIITGVMQAILNVIDFKMNLQEAIDAPRFHHQWQPDTLFLEKGFSPDTIALLKAKGHNVEPNANSVASVQGVLIDGGWLQGAFDGRGSGKAAGF